MNIKKLLKKLLLFLIIIYALVLQFKVIENKNIEKQHLDDLRYEFLNKNLILKVQLALQDSFNLSEDKALTCAALIVINSKRWNIEWEVLASIIRVESNFDYYAKSSMTKGSAAEQMQRAYGLMQIKPTTALACANELGIQWNGLETVQNPIDNIALGSYYYARMNLIFKDFRKNLNAYNCGPQAVYNKVESINHWYRVLWHYKRLKHQSDSSLTETIKKLDEDFINKRDSVKGK